MNRTALGLAVGAGYVLGRTKKMKLAIAVGTMVAGKRMHLSPRALADLVSQQLDKNPQFKEIGDQLREDLSGVGKAATGALVNRQIEGLAGRLHDRTAGVRDQLSGVAPDADDVRDTGERATGLLRRRGRRAQEEPEEESYEDDTSDVDHRDADDRDDEPYEDEAYDEEPDGHDEDAEQAEDGDEPEERRGDGAATKATEKAPPPKKTAAKKAPAKKAAAKKAPAKKAPAKKAAKKTAGAGARAAKGGRGRG